MEKILKINIISASKNFIKHRKSNCMYDVAFGSVIREDKTCGATLDEGNLGSWWLIALVWFGLTVLLLVFEAFE